MKRPDPSSAVDTLRRPTDTPAGADGFFWRAALDPRRWPVQRLVVLAVSTPPAPPASPSGSTLCPDSPVTVVMPGVRHVATVGSWR